MLTSQQASMTTGPPLCVLIGCKATVPTTGTPLYFIYLKPSFHAAVPWHLLPFPSQLGTQACKYTPPQPPDTHTEVTRFSKAAAGLTS